MIVSNKEREVFSIKVMLHSVEINEQKQQGEKCDADTVSALEQAQLAPALEVCKVLIIVICSRLSRVRSESASLSELSSDLSVSRNLYN